jgi:hypothetical protein
MAVIFLQKDHGHLANTQGNCPRLNQIWRSLMNKKLFIFAALLILLVMAAGCAPGKVTQVEIPSVNMELSMPGLNPLVNTTDANGRTAGILLGIWHGIISPVTMVLSFINPELQIYEVYNDGSLYNFGFLIGAAIVFVLLGVLGTRRRV